VTVTPREYRGGEMARRCVDVALAGAAAVVASPVVVTAACLVRWRMGSPVLFRQQRSGLHGAEFTIYKFRTMRAERYPGEPDLERLTAVGRALRMTSLDELPQLWNVLRGDMALVGPRPTLPEQVAHYNERQRGRLAVRPGITGWAQVRARNSISWPQRIELDLWYIRNRSWLLDARIAVATTWRMLRPSGVTAVGGVNPGFPINIEGPPGAPGPEGLASTSEPSCPQARPHRAH
jgi:lipopolysaccharide/colanic/teichoic acid biosynthesis glycosyltransferase